MKKIWLLCLCLASLSLIGCFHIPDEDWLPSKNKTKSENMKKDEDVEQAINSLVQWIDKISSDWNEFGNEENIDITEDVDVDVSEKNNDNEEITDDKVENGEIEENIISEWEI